MHPILFEIPAPWGEIAVYSNGVTLGVSMIAAWFIVMWLGVREGLSRELLANTFIITAVSAIIGARLLYVLTNVGEFDSLGALFDVRGGGLVAYGGFLGGCSGALLYLRSQKKPLLSVADAAAPTLALGLSLSRVGCYLYGCDFGSRLEDDAPEWLRALGTFPHWANDAGSPAWAHHVREYGLEHDAAHSFPVHPTQIYESIAGAALLAMTLVLWRHRSFRGQVLLALTMLYGVWRFFIEYLRDDPERGFAFGFSTSQLVSLALVPLAAFFYQQQRKQHLASPAPVMRLGAPETYSIEPEPTPGETLEPIASEPERPAPTKSHAAPKRKKKPRR